MSSVNSPLAQMYLNRALNAAQIAPAPRPKADSRTADKFVIRSYEGLFIELDEIGRHQGRSRNSEVQAAVLEALAGWKRSTASLNILVSHLGDKVSSRVLAGIPEFVLDRGRLEKKFVLRLLPNVRDLVRDGVQDAELEGGTMNRWFLITLERWINVQRQHYALLSAAMALNPDLVEPFA